MAQGLKAIAESLSIYFDMPGFKYNIKTYFELEESFNILRL